MFAVKKINVDNCCRDSTSNIRKYIDTIRAQIAWKNYVKDTHSSVTP